MAIVLCSSLTGHVQFEDPQDAEDAIRGRDGYDFDGYRLRVSLKRVSCGGEDLFNPFKPHRTKERSTV